jgi:osmoprotectant transport system permease protein
LLTAFLDYVIQNPVQLGILMRQHLEMTFWPIVIAGVLAIPFGIVATRIRGRGNMLLTIANLGQTIPSIAILGLVIPFLGIGFVPAVFAFTLRALLPIFLNTYIGVRDVDPATIEAARGLGMRDLQVLLYVELPLASQLIIAGIRTATVQNVAIVTLGAFIGAGGLGNLILQGLAMMDPGRLLAGAIPAAGLAILLEIGLGWFEKSITPKGLRNT